MKTIGLLGGMSWVSSAEYYRLLNEGVRDRLGEYRSARIVLYSIDFADIEVMQIEDRWADAAKVLGDAGRSVQAAGADLLLICSNTMHKVADEVQAAVGIPLLHLADTTAEAIVQAGLTKVGLLGTAYTMEQDYYRDRLAQHGFEVIVPERDDRAEVHRVIFEELVQGTISAQSRQVYQGVIKRLATAGAQGVILGCTEIELLISAGDSSLPVFPTTRLHVDAAIRAALEEN
ncbi:aspartate racemase [Kibdelosporangium banguiense]|uniref:Aspartate racemase n=1 Tax=Kibdelosporangium banguiense TaxID=1365924 RepID=A0ABS4TP14_9PSEU|nr:aspartate/glutamate racemase family protein [Kibdelosporangium banguiense]MBP2326140.1 aspartate racemase [Kibdelosporangium banguiense]